MYRVTTDLPDTFDPDSLPKSIDIHVERYSTPVQLSYWKNGAENKHFVSIDIFGQLDIHQVDQLRSADYCGPFISGALASYAQKAANALGVLVRLECPAISFDGTATPGATELVTSEVATRTPWGDIQRPAYHN